MSIWTGKTRLRAQLRRRPWPNTLVATVTCPEFMRRARITERPRESASQRMPPLLALWGAKGTVGQMYDVLATWRPKSASSVQGKALDCGHMLPEERPEEV